MEMCNQSRRAIHWQIKLRHCWKYRVGQKNCTRCLWQ